MPTHSVSPIFSQLQQASSSVVSTTKRDHDFERVQLSQLGMERVLTEQKSFHEKLKEAERDFQGEYTAQTFSAAEVEMDKKRWVKINSELALVETSQQHEAQRWERNPANQWADQAEMVNGRSLEEIYVELPVKKQRESDNRELTNFLCRSRRCCTVELCFASVVMVWPWETCLDVDAGGIKDVCISWCTSEGLDRNQR